MVTVTYTKRVSDVDDSISMNNAKVDIGGPGAKVKYRIIKVTRRERKKSVTNPMAIQWEDVSHYEVQELFTHILSKDEWKTMSFHDGLTDENGVSEFESIEEIRNWLVALDGDRIEEVKLYK